MYAKKGKRIVSENKHVVLNKVRDSIFSAPVQHGDTNEPNQTALQLVSCVALLKDYISQPAAV